jgi:hypothetical protein
MTFFPRRKPTQAPLTGPECEMIADAIRVGSSPDGLGGAIGVALVRRYGVTTAYRVADAVAVGIQAAMKDAGKA